MPVRECGPNALGRVRVIGRQEILLCGCWPPAPARAQREEPSTERLGVMNVARNKSKTASGRWNVTTEPNNRCGTLIIRVSGPTCRPLHWVTSEGARRGQMVIVIGGPS